MRKPDDDPAPRAAQAERGWDWEEILVDGKLHCFGYRREAVLIPEPLRVYAA